MAFGEVVLAQDVSRDGHVLHDAGQVREAEIDELAAFVLHQLQYFFGGAFLHGSSCGGCDPIGHRTADRWGHYPRCRGGS
jgi:hypothetical protein